MTTVQLLHRLGRRTRAGDSTKLSLTEQWDVLEAANVAIQSVFAALPNQFKELTEGMLLPAPRSITLAVTQYSTAVSSDAFSESEIGRSVVLDGDTRWNQVVGTNELLLPYTGTTGTVNGTVYGDAWYSDRFPFERIVSNPRFANEGGSTLGRGELSPLGHDFTIWPFQQTSGSPQYWWVQTLGTSQGNEPMLVVRVTPAPSAAEVLRVRIAYHPKRVTLSDYDTATPIPVPDHLVETALIPLGLEALMATPIWDGKGDLKAILAAAERARAVLEKQIPQVAAPSNRIYTPRGF